MRRDIVKRHEGTYAALTVFLVLISLTLYQWHNVSQNAVDSAEQRFDFRVSEITSLIEQRIRAYESALQGGAGLFAAATTVSRKDWQKYVQSLDLNSNYPGIQGLGYARVVEPDEREALVERIREQGYPEFSIWPEGERQVYTAIVYLEPFDWRNRRAFGYDMFSDPLRHEAMARARDTAKASATRAVSLVQETSNNTQKGFLLYLPVYAGGEIPQTLVERRDRLIGYVYSPFRMRDLMQGILGINALVDIRMEIFDGEGVAPDEKIFDSGTGAAAEPDAESLFETTVPFKFAGHQWTLRFSSLPPLEAIAKTGNGQLVLLGGLLISFLLAAFIWALWLNRARGWALAEANINLMQEMTQREHLELRLDRFFSMSTDILSTLNLDGTFRKVNPACEKILGFEARAMEGRHFVDTVHSEDREQAKEELQALAEKKVHRATMEIRNLTDSGGVRWVEWHFVAAEQEPALYANGRDMTERKQMEQQLHRSAFYDKLTGTANRALFLDRLKHVIERAHRYGKNYAVLIMDMDNFKAVNDSYGHLTGDKLLAAFAQRVQQQLRPVDTCARFGGDEFILLIEEAENAEAVRYVAERIQKALSLPFVFDGHELRIGSSMGIAMGDSRYKTTQQALRDADMALYEAKRQGKNRYLFFDEKMRTEQLTRTAVEEELSQALNRQELDVIYQPIIDLRDGQMVGCEALVRWEHPSLGEMSPVDFIPMAEKSGLITAIGRFVTERACQDLAGWLSAPAVPRNLFVSVNLSPKEFFVSGLVEHIDKVLHRHGLQGQNLRLEVTEGVLIERDQEAAVIFRKLQAMGVQICIDDFGTGYSSLSYLQALPINVLKLDRSLIQQIQISETSHEIARTVLSLARALDVQSVAEGAETDDQLQAIKDAGFNFAQGFGLHRPMDRGALEALLHQSLPTERT
jgi:diguanylate cyclase (GGDEF)-like protein/PAS domain S-box-containing protein